MNKLAVISSLCSDHIPSGKEEWLRGRLISGPGGGVGKRSINRGGVEELTRSCRDSK